MRDGLLLLLPDVDRVIISVDTACEIKDPANYKPSLEVLQDATARENFRRGLTIEKLDPRAAPALRLLESFREQGYPIDTYHVPDYFEVYFAGEAHIGTIFLWRERTRPPISEETREFIRRILPFLGYALSDIVAKHHYLLPGERIFHDALRDMSKECHLTIQERRVVNYRLHGYS